MKEVSQVGELQSLGNEELVLSKTEIRRGYFYKIRRVANQIYPVTHYIFVVDVSKKSKMHLKDIMEGLKWALSNLEKQVHHVSITVFSGKKEMSWLYQGVNPQLLMEQFDEMEQALSLGISHFSTTSLINGLEGLMQQCRLDGLDSECLQVIVFSSGTLPLLEYEMDLKRQHFIQVATWLQSNQVRLDLISFESESPLVLLRWLKESTVRGGFYHCLKRSDVLFFLRRIINHRTMRLSVEGKDFFLCHQKQRETSKKQSHIEVVEGEIIVIFDEPLDSCDFLIQPSSQMIQREILYFFKQYASYLILTTHVLEAYELLIHNGCEQAANYIKDRCNNQERVQSMKWLSTYRGDKEVKGNKEQALCLFSLVQLIIEDEKSRILWNRHQSYARMTFPNKLKDEKFRFIEKEVDFIEVQDWIVGEKKLNVALKVKVDGQVEELKTGLKLDAYVFKTFTIVLDGNVKVNELYCRLSDDLRRKCQKAKIIKRVIDGLDEKIYVIDLKRLPLTCRSLYEGYTLDQVGDLIYENERLKCWQSLLKEMIEAQWKKNKWVALNATRTDDLKQKMKRRYHLSDSGQYIPPVSQTNNRSESEFYVTRMVEWKIFRFKKEQEKHRAYEFILNRAANEGISLDDILSEELRMISKKRQQIQKKLHLIRISVSLTQVDFFNWDERRKVSKVQMDTKSKLNMVLRGEMNVAIKHLSCFTIQENAYTVLVRGPSLME